MRSENTALSRRFKEYVGVCYTAVGSFGCGCPFVR